MKIYILLPRITASTIHVTLALIQGGSPAAVTWHDSWLQVLQYVLWLALFWNV